ncbi:hypothetical protein BH23GEM3_BH23GEM3_24090 [soil metagenome]
MKPRTLPFVVGRLTGNDRCVIVLGRAAPPSPIRGPWELRAVFAR